MAFFELLQDEYVPDHIDKDLLLERLCRAMNTECEGNTDGGGKLVATPLILENSNHNSSNDDEDRAIFINAVFMMIGNIAKHEKQMLHKLKSVSILHYEQIITLQGFELGNNLGVIEGAKVDTFDVDRDGLIDG